MLLLWVYYERQTGNSFFLWIVSNCRLPKCYQEKEELMHMLLCLDADETLCSYFQFLTIICNIANELCTLLASPYDVNIEHSENEWTAVIAAHKNIVIKEWLRRITILWESSFMKWEEAGVCRVLQNDFISIFIWEKSQFFSWQHFFYAYSIVQWPYSVDTSKSILRFKMSTLRKQLPSVS